MALEPNIDRAASAGTVFTNSYRNNLFCSLPQTSMMTGRLFSEIGVFNNDADFVSVSCSPKIGQ